MELGKTKFVEGILSHFDLQDEISSPTFTIVNEYDSDTGLKIYHFDLYRLKDMMEFENIGGEEYFGKGLCLIEWGELIEDLIPEDFVKIIFEKDETDEEKRILNIKTYGDKYKNLDFTKFI